MAKYNEQSVYSGVDQKSFYVTYLDTYKAAPIRPDPTDTLIVIPHTMNERPEMLSFQLYGTVDLWWIFALRNPDLLIDPIYDFTTSKEIYAPSKERATGFTRRS